MAFFVGFLRFMFCTKIISLQKQFFKFFIKRDEKDLINRKLLFIIKNPRKNVAISPKMIYNKIEYL